MAELLLDHLRHGMALPFARGRSDCTTWVCDWIRAARGVDPIAAWRGRYRTTLGAERHIRAGGGAEALARRAMAAAGLAETSSPRAGDVGLVRDAAGQLVLAIRTERGWAAKAARGLAIGEFPVVVAWSV